MQGANTINLYVLIKNEHTQIELSNVHSLLKLYTNVISLGLFEEKRYEFCILNSLLQIKDKENNIVIEFFRNNGVYLFWKSRLLV